MYGVAAEGCAAVDGDRGQAFGPGGAARRGDGARALPASAADTVDVSNIDPPHHD